MVSQRIRDENRTAAYSLLRQGRYGDAKKRFQRAVRVFAPIADRTKVLLADAGFVVVEAADGVETDHVVFAMVKTGGAHAL